MSRKFRTIIVLFTVLTLCLSLLGGCRSGTSNSSQGNTANNTAEPVSTGNTDAAQPDDTANTTEQGNTGPNGAENTNTVQEDTAQTDTTEADDNIVRMNWADLEKQYGGLDGKGKVVEFKEYGFSIFIPEEFTQNDAVTDTDPGRERSIASFSAKDRYTLSIIYCVPPYDTGSLDEVAARFAGDSTASVTDVIINGIPFVKIDLSGNDLLRYAAKASYFMKDAEAEKCIIFSFTPTNKTGHEASTDMMVFSIMPVGK